MRRYLSLLSGWLRFLTKAAPVAGAVCLGACSHQAVAPGASEPAAPSGAVVVAFQPAPLAASVFVVHSITDLGEFEKYFESGNALRAAGSVKGYLLSRLDDGKVVIHFFAEDLDHVQAALNSERMQGYLNRTSAPDASLVWITRDVSLALSPTRPAGKTFSLYFKLQVADIEAFKQGFDARDGLYAAYGVVGRGLHQSTSGRVVVLHFVGTSRERLEALTKEPDFGRLLALAEPEGAARPLLAEDLARSRPE